MAKILVQFAEHGPYFECLSETCKFQRSCAQHRSAGDFRSESGFTPEVFTVRNGDQICNTYDQPIDEENDDVRPRPVQDERDGTHVGYDLDNKFIAHPRVERMLMWLKDQSREIKITKDDLDPRPYRIEHATSDYRMNVGHLNFDPILTPFELAGRMIGNNEAEGRGATKALKLLFFSDVTSPNEDYL